MPSITDQIFIKAERIRSLQEKAQNLVGDSIESEFTGIINYAVIALILVDLQGESLSEAYLEAHLSDLYDEKVEWAFQTMLKKNHDYGEAWRKMRISSMVDLILVKLLRLKRIEDNQGKTLVSEGISSHYIDILNYAVFSLILMGEKAPAQEPS